MLSASLSLIFEDEDGLSGLYQKQWAMSQMTRTGICAIGLEPFAKTHYAWGLTSVRMPGKVKASELVAQAAKRTGVIIAAGQAPMKDEILRLAHMGWVDFADIMAGLHSIDLCLPHKSPNYQCDYLNRALDAWHTACPYPKDARG
jgi:aspartate aminotransferase-like enzyme